MVRTGTLENFGSGEAGDHSLPLSQPRAPGRRKSSRLERGVRAQEGSITWAVVRSVMAPSARATIPAEDGSLTDNYRLAILGGGVPSVCSVSEKKKRGWMKFSKDFKVSVSRGGAEVHDKKKKLPNTRDQRRLMNKRLSQRGGENRGRSQTGVVGRRLAERKNP